MMSNTVKIKKAAYSGSLLENPLVDICYARTSGIAACRFQLRIIMPIIIDIDMGKAIGSLPENSEFIRNNITF